MTLVIKVPTTSTANDLPKFYPDSRMNKGSLLLIDFSHPDCPLASVPATGAVINNIAWKNAQKLIPTGTQTTLSPVVTNNIVAGAGLMEITPKKGLHGIISQVNDSSSTVGINDFDISIPLNIATYIFDNITRGFYVSIWDRKTRLSTFGISFFTICLSNGGNYIFDLRSDTATYNSNLGSRGLRNNLSNQVINGGFSQKIGSPTAGNLSKFRWGTFYSGGSAELNKGHSSILYQIHIVDLTSAGLTYAQADALDLAAFNAAFGSGGRFENDTFTNPSTLP